MDMISVGEARRRVLENLPARRAEQIDFEAALGRVLAEDIFASTDVPSFDRAAVDGYALRAADVHKAPVELELVGELRAGSESASSISDGQAIAVTTGTRIPAGADAVQWLEHSQLSGDGRWVTVRSALEPGDNVVPRAAEAACGEIVLETGRALGPADLAVLATFGWAQVRVWRRPRVAVLVTGDELVEVRGTLRPGQIRNSNAYSISAQLRHLGIEPESLGIAPDDPAELSRKVAEGLERDVLLVTGGASVGRYDFVKDVLRALGVNILFSRVAMRPGKPTVFGRKGDTLVFGLPGNPVSSFVAFENFARPALGRMCGYARPDLPSVIGELQSSIKQVPGRTAFLPAKTVSDRGSWKIQPLSWKGSGDMISFARSNALLIFPCDRDSMSAGEPVESLLLPDFFIRS